MLDKILTDFLFLWATIDPIGTLAIFASLTAAATGAERRLEVALSNLERARDKLAEEHVAARRAALAEWLLAGLRSLPPKAPRTGKRRAWVDTW